MNRPRVRSLSDTPFSIDRLFVWAIGIGFITGLVAMIFQTPVKPQIQSVTMICLGALVSRVESMMVKGK